MHITGIGSATPPTAFDKAACLAALERPPWITRLNPCSIDLLRLVLQQDNGIDSRQLAVDSRDEAISIDPDTLARRFETHAPQLAAQADRPALDDANLVANEVAPAVVSTCTGALCPGWSGHRIDQRRLRPEDLRHSADMLRRHGNLTSAFVCFVLRSAVAEPAPAGWWWLSSFGAGLACHGTLLEVG